MKASLAVVCAVLLSLGATAPAEQREVGEDAEDGVDEVGCVEEAAGAAELSVLSGQNASGHWLAKVRLQHAAGAAGDGASLPPVHLQLQRSAQRRRGGASTVALEATLAGSPITRPDDPAANSGIPDSAFSASLDSKAACPSPEPCPACPTSQPCPACPTPQPCPSPCPARCPDFPFPVACPVSPICPSPCPAPTPAPRRIPPGYVLRGDFGYYKYHTVAVTWFQAKATCEREGAHLVILNSKDEAQTVANLFKETGLPIAAIGYGIRIGIHDLMLEGTFLTVLGQPIAAAGFAEWYPNEPNNAFGGEHCGTMGLDLKINDIRCDWNGTYVCELPNETKNYLL